MPDEGGGGGGGNNNNLKETAQYFLVWIYKFFCSHSHKNVMQKVMLVLILYKKNLD